MIYLNDDVLVVLNAHLINQLLCFEKWGNVNFNLRYLPLSSCCAIISIRMLILSLVLKIIIEDLDIRYYLIFGIP